MPKSGDVRTCTTYSPVGSAHVWGSRSSSAPADGRDRLADDEREEHEDRDRSERSAHELTAPHRRLQRSGALRHHDRAGDDAPRRDHEPGDHEEEEPEAHADLVDDHGRHEREPRHGAQELPRPRELGPVQVAGDDLLRRGGEQLGDEQLEHQHDEDVDRDVTQAEAIGVDRTPCATPVSSRIASGNQSSAAIAVRYQKWRRQNRTESRRTAPSATGATGAAEVGGGDDTATARSYESRASRSWPLTGERARRTLPTFPEHFLLLLAHVRAPRGRSPSMLIALWSATGGSGTSVLTAACALVLARQARDAGHATGVRVADLAGDLPAVFGLGADPDVGLADWLDAGAEAPTEALDRLLVEVAPGVALLPRGRGPRVPTTLPAPESGAALAVALTQGSSPVLVDCGTAREPAARAVVEVADVAVVVLRGCYLALRRAVHSPPLEHTAGVVLLDEPGRSLGAKEIGEVLDLPVLARIPVKDGDRAGGRRRRAAGAVARTAGASRLRRRPATRRASRAPR